MKNNLALRDNSKELEKLKIMQLDLDELYKKSKDYLTLYSKPGNTDYPISTEIWRVIFDGWKYAWKAYEIDATYSRGIKAVFDEIEIQTKLVHENTVGAYGFTHETLHNDRIIRLTIFMQYCSKGSLGDTISYAAIPLPINTIKKYALNVLSGLIYLHGEGIVHRDLKPQNIYINEDDHAQIGDFGLSIEIKDQPINVFDPYIPNKPFPTEYSGGTFAFLAPETMIYNNIIYYGSATDMYSFGLTLFAISTNMWPWLNLPWQAIDERRHPDLIQAVTHKAPLFDENALSHKGFSIKEKRTTLPPSIAQLISRCREYSPLDRPTAKQAYEELLKSKMQESVPEDYRGESAKKIDSRHGYTI